MIATEKLPVPPVLGGAIQTYISGSLPYLAKSFNITVLGITDPSLPDEEFKDGIRYIRVPGKLLALYERGIIQFLSSHSFDIIHIFNRPRLVMPVRRIAPQSKIILSMHNDMFNPEKISPIEAKSVLNEVSMIVTVSDYVGNVIRSLYPQASSKLRTIYSGVDSERFLPGNHPKMKAIRDQLRKEHDLEDKQVILFAGRLSANKGVDRLIRALPLLSEKFNNLALVVVGSNWFSQNVVTDYVAYIRSLVNQQDVPVVTTGFVSAAEIQNWFAAADLFVCTSIWQEPLARVHYEAMAAGLPIVTTARGGNREVIDIGENGFVVENPEDPANFAEKISAILSNKSLMQSMGKRGRTLAVSRYNWPRVAEEIMGVWEHTLQLTNENTNPEAENPQNILPPYSDPEKAIDTEQASIPFTDESVAKEENEHHEDHDKEKKDTKNKHKKKKDKKDQRKKERITKEKRKKDKLKKDRVTTKDEIKKPKHTKYRYVKDEPKKDKYTKKKYSKYTGNADSKTSKLKEKYRKLNAKKRFKG